MVIVKVVVTGPFAAGKTTLIRTISEASVLSTERDISDHTRVLKPSTTVAMDFGRITVDPLLVLFLFGTPGQDRFDFMWKILSTGMLGFILVVDAARPESYDEARGILEAFKEFGQATFVVAVNKHADPQEDIDRAREGLGIDDGTRVVAVNATERESVKQVLLALLDAAGDRMEAHPVGSGSKR